MNNYVHYTISNENFAIVSETDSPLSRGGYYIFCSHLNDDKNILNKI